MNAGLVELPKWVTTEGVLSVTGAAWFLLHALVPVVPDFMPLGIPVPGFENLTITPGLLVSVAVIPVVLKMIGTGRTPFSNAVTPTEGK